MTRLYRRSAFVLLSLELLDLGCARAPREATAPPPVAAAGPSRAIEPPAEPAEAAPPADVRRPLIVVTRSTVSLDGVVVASAPPLDSAGHLTRLDDLFAPLERQHQDAGANASVQWLDARDAGALAAVDALRTAELAGFRDVRFRTASGWIAGHDDDALDPSSAETRIHRRLVLDVGRDAIALAWQADEACDQVPPVATLASNGLEAYLSSFCTGKTPCVDAGWVAFDAALPFRAALDALEVLRGHSDERFGFALRPETTHAGQAPERTCGAPLRRRTGIAPDEIQQTVRANFARMRACYDEGLRRSPKLRGRLSTKLVIDPAGHITEVSTVDADAPGALPSRAVAGCVRDVFKTLTFRKPLPGASVTTVVYPIVFEPAD